MKSRPVACMICLDFFYWGNMRDEASTTKTKPLSLKDRLELKPTRSNQGSDTWIAVFQALLSKAKSFGYIPSFQVSFYCLYPSQLRSSSASLHVTILALGFHYAPVPLEVSVGHVQTISTGVGQAFLQLMLPLIYHVYHRSELDPFLYDRKSNATYAFPRHLTVEHVIFL